MVKSRPLLTCMMLSLAWLVTGGASDDRDGFLSPGEFDVAAVLEPAPRRTDPRYEADRKIFRATRMLQGTPRWQLATNDTKTSATAMMQNFSCAAGIELTPQAAPKLAELVRRASLDTVGQTTAAKNKFVRLRPFLIDRGSVCQPVQELLDRKHNRVSYDYPSGHTTLGWTWALVLTAVMPERGQQILARGRAYGESRLVCGAHNKSAVEAGFQSASATMAIISAKSTFQSALSEAREEVAALKIKGTVPSQAQCDEEQKLITLNVFH